MHAHDWLPQAHCKDIRMQFRVVLFSAALENVPQCDPHVHESIFLHFNEICSCTHNTGTVDHCCIYISCCVHAAPSTPTSIPTDMVAMPTDSTTTIIIVVLVVLLLSAGERSWHLVQSEKI